MDFLMGEYGMTYRDARKVPWDELHLLWHANRRREARRELEWLDDAYATAGLTSEVKVKGEKQPKKGKEIIPVALLRRREILEKRGYPRKPKPWSVAQERKKLASFWSAVDDAPIIDFGGSDEAD